MERRIRFSIWYAVAAFLILSAIQTYLNANVEEIAYSDFRRLVAEGKVRSCAIGPEQIRGTLEEKSRHGDGNRTFSTMRVEDSDLVKLLEQHKVNFTGQVDSDWFRTVLSWIVPALIFFGLWAFLFRRMSGPMGGVMSIGKSKAKIYVEDKTKVTFNDVAGIDEAEEELKEIVEFLKTPEKFKRLGGRIPKGVLLVGPPGTGKTLLARAVAGESGVPFFSLSGSDFVEMFVGVGASRVRDLFQQAKSHAPCIIFIDELDALGKARGINPVGGHDEREQTLNQLLTEMDGFDANVGVILMAATNRPEILDLALLRPGRFDRHVVVDRPDIKGREAILKVHARQAKLADDVDLRTIAARTPGFVGADLANVINEAALRAARGEQTEIEMKDLEEAIDRVVAGLERKSRAMSEKEREIVAYHEAGHAIVSEVLPGVDRLHRISIIPRGVAALGYTMLLPTEDRYLMTREELLRKVDALLGGRAAEEIVFREVSTGAQDDLQRVTKIAESMVKDYGMSDRLGLVSYNTDRISPFLGIPMGGEKRYSEETARLIDAEIARIVDEAHTRVRKILEDHRPVLERLAKVLLEREVVEREEVSRMVAEHASGRVAQEARA
ncbi:MAG: cell division protein FtsH [Candidatus Handelsmanbacteria bacterium RIFCSPLOWO2_12_FULL_64_10]|uniref:ATP-dependent zinc metalloprotease FtsH n=1 Tax=Handelsmanbacteria sp. (strain RIFCSPLOWO2_12_FULL_64_10) TaxID=1817868 RepID=A0A1F6CQ36_HANXR|nr:MAG: cell division protein FtsH [Candidatus Handelsmanbacteria bacterium RIFCSPLOWO2_12_FULL_64_10]